MSGARFCRQCGVPLLEVRDDGLCAGCYMLQQHPDGLSKRKELGGVPFKDFKHLDEDERIKQLVEMLKEERNPRIGYMVDCGPEHHGKGDRIIEKVKKLLPEVRIVARHPGPVAEVETIHFKL